MYCTVNIQVSLDVCSYRAMKPKVLLNLIPKFLNDLPDLQPRNIVALKVHTFYILPYVCACVYVYL